MTKQYYHRQDVIALNENNVEVVREGYVMLHKCVYFIFENPVTYEFTIMPPEFKPDHIDHLLLNDDFTNDGFKIINGVVQEGVYA
jgi:hypothetical protein